MTALDTNSGLDELINFVLISYNNAKMEDMTLHPTGIAVRRLIPDRLISILGTEMHIKGSCGGLSWSEVPWVAISSSKFSIQYSVYVALLFAADSSGFAVALTHGVGKRSECDILQSRNKILGRIDLSAIAATSDQPPLKAKNKLGRMYQSATICHYWLKPHEFSESSSIDKIQSLIALKQEHGTHED